MWPNLHESADLVTFTEEILNGKVVSGEIKTVCSEEAEKKGTVNLVATKNEIFHYTLLQ